MFHLTFVSSDRPGDNPHDVAFEELPVRETHLENHSPENPICAANRKPDGTIEFVPFAMMFDDNPYRTVNPPRADSPGFYLQNE